MNTQTTFADHALNQRMETISEGLHTLEDRHAKRIKDLHYLIDAQDERIEWLEEMIYQLQDAIPEPEPHDTAFVTPTRAVPRRWPELDPSLKCG